MPKRAFSQGRPARGSRRLWVVGLGVVLLVLWVAPVRRQAMATGGWVVRAVLAAQEAELHRRAVARYTARYGIGPGLAAAIYEAARAEGVDPDLAFRLVRVESQFKETAVSPAGALGLTQLMPGTAAELRPGITRAEVLDRETNLRLGFRYLHWLLRVYNGDVADALHAYNRGPGTVDRIRAVGGDPANGYADRVTGWGRPANPYRGNGLLRERQGAVGR